MMYNLFLEADHVIYKKIQIGLYLTIYKYLEFPLCDDMDYH